MIWAHAPLMPLDSQNFLPPKIKTIITLLTHEYDSVLIVVTFHSVSVSYLHPLLILLPSSPLDLVSETSCQECLPDGS